MRYRYILFDLDGTLTDPKMGITKSVAYALNRMRQIDVDLDGLTKFIGPPLKESFIHFYNFSDAEAEQAIYYYREYFKDTGIFENELYEGVKDLLKELKDEGRVLAVATSKPTIFAEMILRYFDIDTYFNYVVGSNLDGTRTQKAEVIEEVISSFGLTDREPVIMIGDREHDIIGANKVGIDSIGVQYGYGDYDELERAGANFIVSTIGELRKLLLEK